ncbi:MAG: AbgT family transporter [Treponema sp.]|jgi:aminobenzoyl-glutamate transport protein|nr:AbgT family transporter [Treponema sp.]
MKTTSPVNEKPGLIYRMLNWVESAGNKMPDPISIFGILCLLVILCSALVSFFGVTAIHPKDGSIVEPVNLLTKEHLQTFLGSLPANFQNFPPLALVLMVMFGVGIADKTGLLEAALKGSLSNLPKGLVSWVIIFVGILANVAGDAGFIVLPALAAIVFISVGRHPFIGIFAAFGGVAAGFAANLILGLSDVLAASFTIPAAQMIDPSYKSSPAMNYYFIIVSTVFLSVVGTIVTEKIIAPRFENEPFENPGAGAGAETSDAQKKGLRWAGFSFLALLVLLVILCLGPAPFMADPATGSIVDPNAPLMKGVIPILTVIFLIPGIIYGAFTGSIKNDKDVVKMMSKALSEMGGYIVLAFAASQFLALFNYTRLGTLLAIKGADALKGIGLTGMGLIIAFILFSSILNLFIGSASAKWAIMAPIFVPMFMLLGFEPPLTQMAYRIGDSVSNPISPLFPYFPILLGYLNLYKKNSGIGTVIANMLPYSICFFFTWTILLLIYVALGLPLGPN